MAVSVLFITLNKVSETSPFEFSTNSELDGVGVHLNNLAVIQKPYIFTWGGATLGVF